MIRTENLDDKHSVSHDEARASSAAASVASNTTSQELDLDEHSELLDSPIEENIVELQLLSNGSGLGSTSVPKDIQTDTKLDSAENRGGRTDKSTEEPHKKASISAPGEQQTTVMDVNNLLQDPTRRGESVKIFKVPAILKQVVLEMHSRSWTPFHVASDCGNFTALKKMMQYCQLVLSEHHSELKEALKQAAGGGARTKIASESELSRAFFYHVFSKIARNGQTCLHLAAYRGFTDICVY